MLRQTYRPLAVVVLIAAIANAPIRWAVAGDPTELLPDGFLQQTSLSGAPLPTSWSQDSVRWQAELAGYGQSMPIVWRSRIYVTCVAGDQKDECVVECFEAATGARVWQYRQASSHKVKSGPMISRAAPTPVCDEQAIYAFFETGDLIALSHDGSLLWQLDLQDQFGAFENKFGLSASVSHYGNRLYILLDHKGESSLVSLNKRDGTLHWRTPRGRREHSWSSPAIIHVEKRPTIVCSSPGSIAAYDIDTGELLAEFTDVGGNSVATPVDLGSGRFLMASLVRPADGPSRGALTSNMLLRLESNEGALRFRRLWVAEDARGSFASPILHREECYFVNPQGVLYCVDAGTGEQRYAKRLPCGGCWATPIACNDRVYFFGRDGQTTILRAGSKYEILVEENFLKPEFAEEHVDTDQSPALARNSRPSLYAVVAMPKGLLFRFGSHLFMVPPAPTP
jgi:outer membrane protein assembly factor BamB